MRERHTCIKFDELNLVICKADSKRKIVNPVWDKMYLNSVPVFYGMGYVFRDKNNSKKYYSSEEVEERIKQYLHVKSNILN